MTKVYRITPYTALERTRVNQHGELWFLVTSSHVRKPGHMFLESVNTGYQRWWNLEQIVVHQKTEKEL